MSARTPKQFTSWPWDQTGSNPRLGSNGAAKKTAPPSRSAPHIAATADSVEQRESGLQSAPAVAPRSKANSNHSDLPLALTPLLASLEQTAAMLSISTSSLQRLVRAGKFPKPRLVSDRRVAWLVEEVQRFARQLPQADLLPPPNTGWTRSRSGIERSLKRSPAPSPVAQPAACENKLTHKTSWHDARRDRDGMLAKAGGVYQIPGTDVVCLRRYRWGALPMPFAIVIHEGRHTWAEMELSGEARNSALRRLKGLNKACSVMAADAVDAENLHAAR
jgi:prophage regulatory protein